MAVASISRRPEVAGLVLWGVALVAIPAPLAARLWLAVPFVLVPLLAPALARSGGGSAGLLSARPWPAIGAGVLAAGALAFPAGSFAAGASVVPWLLLALGELASTIPGGHGWRSPGLLGRAGALGFLAVGAGSLLCERMGIGMLGFDATIVLLTAVHFSVAGFGLLGVAVLRAATGGRLGRIAVPGLLVGMPLTAVGWLVGTPLAAWPGTLVVAGSGLSVAVDLLAGSQAGPARERVARWVGGIALGAGMVLAIGWSTALLLGIPYLDLTAMVRTHGALNLVGVLLAAWWVGRVPALKMTPVGLRRVRGGLVALAIGAPVACWIAWALPGASSAAIDPARLAVTALIGPAVAGWLLADTPSRSVGDGAVRIGAMALSATLAAALVGAVLLSLHEADPWRLAIRVPFRFLMGIGLLGPWVLAASVPAALAWLVVTDRLTRRAGR